jgi:hypothetical protein
MQNRWSIRYPYVTILYIYGSSCIFPFWFLLFKISTYN